MLAPGSWLRWAVFALVVAATGQIALPPDTALKAWTYVVVAAAAIGLAVLGLISHRPARPLGWVLVILGFGGWALGDLQWTIENYVLYLDAYPVPSDALYLTSYLVIAAGIIVMIRTQRSSSPLGSVLDSTIIATGCSIFVASAVILPLATDPEVGTFATIVSSAYPIGDIVLLVTAAQLWTTPQVRSRAYGLLLLSLVASFVPDLVWNAVATSSSITVSSQISDAIFLLVYVLVAAAACDPSMRALGQANHAGETAVTSRRRLTLLAIGLLMPAGALLVTGDATRTGGLPLIGIGAIVLSVLTLLRMGSLLNVISAQAVQLAALASCDALTGAPNRRRWDHELSTACQISLEEGTPLSIAMIDLDNFKRFNDKHGHPAGDLLLREAVASWTDVLGDRGLLARYGGEEFAVLLPRTNADEAVNVIYALRAVTPSGQTFSAGVSSWHPGTEPAIALAHADQGLYNAKRGGRDRIVAYPQTDVAATLTVPTPTIVVQPIVDLNTGQVVAHEALSRFGDRSPQAVFHLASTGGYGDVLEGRAIAAALAMPGRPATDLHVNASAAAMRSERFWDHLPDDLTGLVIEISEQYDGAGLPALCQAVDRLRARGARIATDDLGSGSHELLRLAAVRPDVVKLDLDLVAGCAHDIGRQAVIRGALEFTRSLGSQLCAEGVEDIDDLVFLRNQGVQFAQCFLIARPAATWAPGWLPLPFTAPVA